MAEAMRSAATKAYEAVLRPIEGTILTVVREAADAAEARAAGDGSLVEVLDAARAAGADALERTPELLPVLKEAGVVDAGGAGFLLLLDAALHVVDGRPLPDPPEVEGAVGDQFAAVAHRAGVDGAIDVSELRYEVMYFLDLLDERIGDFKEAWGEIGDSIVVVGGDGIWNCHVHTNDIGAAIEAALGLDGRPRQIRVTDLFEEIADEHAVREAAMRGTAGLTGPATAAPGFTPASAGLLPVTTAVVAVCSGDGLAELFWQLGVQGIVTGGQTMNPSTAELLDAVAHVNADQVVILPNNKNIIPVAEQVDALSSKHVAVVPTRSMPEALAALVLYDPEGSAEANAAAMSDAADSVATGEVTRAVRDTSAEVGRITAGDWIGLVRGDGVVSVSGSLEGAATSLLDQLVTDEREILTIITGADAPRAVTEALQVWANDNRPGLQVEVHAGGQPLYPYLFGVE
jgi:DAK2 domain fusion protein YloV